jgi:hypothetical protein
VEIMEEFLVDCMDRVEGVFNWKMTFGIEVKMTS